MAWVVKIGQKPLRVMMRHRIFPRALPSVGVTSLPRPALLTSSLARDESVRSFSFDALFMPLWRERIDYSPYSVAGNRSGSRRTSLHMLFSELGLTPSLCSPLARLGYKEPTPIQTLAIPAVLTGTDLLARAQTGTGKTAAFGLPMIERLVVLGGGARTRH